MHRLIFIYLSVLAIGIIVIGVTASYVFSTANSCQNAFYSATIYGTQTIKAGQTNTLAFRIVNNAPVSLTLKKVYADASEGLNVVNICIEGYASRGAPVEGSFPGLIGDGDGLERLNINGEPVPAGESVVLAIAYNISKTGNYSINHVHIEYSYLFLTYNQTLPALSRDGLLIPFNISISVS